MRKNKSSIKEVPTPDRGPQNGVPVKPFSLFSRDPQTIVHREFIDYQAMEVKRGPHYFKPLDQTILKYANHPEYKYAANIGHLERRHLVVDYVIHIGKEANDIDDQARDVRKAQMFRNKKTECQKILAIRQCDAEKAGVDRNLPMDQSTDTEERHDRSQDQSG